MPYKLEGFNPYFFYGGVFSQWATDTVQFEEDSIKFNCAEQYMMYHKAVAFLDEESAELIMKATDPRVQKALGRKVKGFRPMCWDIVKLDIVRRGNMLKFTQNLQYKDVLLTILGSKRYLVEASPYDKIWGIGISTSDAKRGVPWDGQNLLGQAITEVGLELTK